MEVIQQFGNDLMKGDAKSWAILGGSVTAYLLLKRATAPAEDPRPAGKHIAKVLFLGVPFYPLHTRSWFCCVPRRLHATYHADNWPAPSRPSFYPIDCRCGRSK